jgi:O-acetyl-ADP-ribose deacetylase (regulator of RNase III)
MARQFRWTNASVVAFTDQKDPVEVMEGRARVLALNAMDDGWHGPPFDPLALAQWLGIPIEARGDIPDARMVPMPDGTLVLEYNPMRPRGRLRFSIAHEIAHSLFPDCAVEVRNRGAMAARASDNWQLEVLCNIGAAELLMPLGSFSNFAGTQLSISAVMELRKRFDVSVEACLIRIIKLARSQSAAFCASKHADGRYHVDYVIPAPGWSSPISTGLRVPVGSVIEDANAIGYTATGSETWGTDAVHVECVGLAPYPGAVTPRVVGFLTAQSALKRNGPDLVEVSGDALSPRGKGPRLVAHVVPNTPRIWGGAGFASKVRRSYPDAWQQFKRETIDRHRAPVLGEVFLTPIDGDITFAHMVAQHGIGPSATQRLRYAALAQCLAELRDRATDLGATVHMPRIGTGHGGASWDVIKELITGELVDKGVPTTVYSLPT